MNLKTLPIRALPILALVGLGGCATVVHGTHQNIAIKSTPPNATVYVDGKKDGHTPEKVSMSRGKEHEVKIVKDGYYPLKQHIFRKGSMTSDFGGLPGKAIDGLDGAGSDLVPGKISAKLNRKPKEAITSTSASGGNESNPDAGS